MVYFKTDEFKPEKAHESLKPVYFHPFKHHLGYLLEYCRQYKPEYGLNYLPLAEHLKTIGHCQLDLYTGKLKPDEICNEITTCYADNKTLFDKKIFILNSYCQVSLSDNSVWTARKATDTGYIIHIHPARVSPYAIRVRSAALKTAIGVSICSNNQKPDILLINKIRNDLLIGPPIGGQMEIKQIFKLVELLFQPNDG